ncbi:uncharacterized protein O3C94_000445 [Discoglossus pictus]
MHEKPMDLQAPFTEHFDGVKEQVRKVATSDVIDISSDSSTQLPALDLCPHDVLYITDLLTFSSRFCGSNSPLNKSLVFGSQVEKTEVIIELITTTNRGRGFAMFFHYENQTMVTSMGMQGRHGGESVMLLAVTTATISLALVLLLVLCLTYRQKMCPKRVQEPDQVIPQMTGNHNAALEVNELQLVVPDEELQIRELGSASQEEVTTEPSHPSLQEDAFSSIPAITDSHSDEVFIISAGKNTEGFTFTSYSLQEGNLKRSVTSPASVSDWLSSDYTSVDLGGEEKSNESVEIDPARQRTWSVRTFNSLLPPIPQLQMKWRSRTSSGSFTKLVDSRCTIPPRNPSPGNPRRAGSAVQMESSRLYSESSSSNASYPLTQSAQEQRKLPSCNLKKSRFASPYFGFLNGSSECLRNGKNISSQENHNLCQKSAVEFTGCSKSTTPRSVRVKDPSMDVETPKTVFVISEEADDQQPLVSDDRLNPSSDCVSEPRSIRCKADIHTVKSTRSLSDLSPWIQSTESYRYQYTENMLSGNPGDVCTTNVERQPQSGLATARLYLEHLQPV